MNVIPKHSTAILIFANSSQEELRHKKINNGKFLFDALTRHTIKAAKETGIPFYHFTEKLQEGICFGERFSNAIQDIFDLGYQNIITVGNDSPHLTKEKITTAISALNENKLVLGPSADGGFYLMGLQKSDFKKERFENLSWQTSNISKELFELLSSTEREWFMLPQLFDIDSFWDVGLIAKYSTGLTQEILKIVQSIISISKKIEIASTIYPNGCYYQTPSNKGSPVYLFS